MDSNHSFVLYYDIAGKFDIFHRDGFRSGEEFDNPSLAIFICVTLKKREQHNNGKHGVTRVDGFSLCSDFSFSLPKCEYCFSFPTRNNQSRNRVNSIRLILIPETF